MTDHQQTTLNDLFAPAPVAGGEAEAILAETRHLFARLEALPENERIDTVNHLRLALREHSPLKNQPVDCVVWVEADEVAGNEYNPNHVADPEMDLLGLSIRQDGYTQPIPAWPSEGTGGTRYEVVDGFHRHLVGKNDQDVKNGDRTAGHILAVAECAGMSAPRLAERFANCIRKPTRDEIPWDRFETALTLPDLPSQPTSTARRP
ncbi:ParB N-terminal domain-containing protein [Streptomyces sp. NPDC087897]|uniref:ParB N-terminal domain-containing protein n=1 Tax=Streptomyces sp. NPDC087897 TaxID=3365817 RepID=UPI003805AADF